MIKELRNSGIGIQVEEVKVSSLFFADDVVVMAENREGLQRLIDLAVDYSVKWRFTFNVNKCKVVIFGKENKESYKIGHQELEVVSKYKDLGIIFDKNLTWKEHKSLILAKARKKAYMVIGLAVGRGLRLDLCLKLWESVIRPGLEYGAEVWGEGEWEEAERLQREMGRLILGAAAKTANEVVLGELGLWSLKARRDKIRMKFLKYVVSGGGGELCHVLLENGCWLKAVAQTMTETELGGVNVRVGDADVWRKLVTDKVQAVEQRNWERGIERKTKLRTYEKIKTGLGKERYLQVGNDWVRKAVTRLRGGTNWLKIETDRWVGKKVEERTCDVCGTVEDERHFLTECKIGDLPRMELCQRMWEGKRPKLDAW